MMKNLPADTNYFDPLQLVSLLDYEDENDNPVEDKYRTLAHDLLRGLVDPALKPDREQRNRLANIIDSPSHHPSREEKDLLWRFRFSLVDNRRALTKFFKREFGAEGKAPAAQEEPIVVEYLLPQVRPIAVGVINMLISRAAPVCFIIYCGRSASTSKSDSRRRIKSAFSALLSPNLLLLLELLRS